MKQIIYKSINVDLDPETLKELLDQAQRNNKLNDITGVLLFSDPYFMQVLEGASAAVDRLFDKIVMDPRHTDVVTVLSRPIATREFPEWSMHNLELNLPPMDAGFFKTGGWQLNGLAGLAEGRAKRVLTAFTEGHWCD